LRIAAIAASSSPEAAGATEICEVLIASAVMRRCPMARPIVRRLLRPWCGSGQASNAEPGAASQHERQRSAGSEF
jgi:hypothetical protein